MKIVVFLLFFAFAEPLKLEDVDISKMAGDFVRGNRLSMKDIIQGIMENFVGHKKTNVSLVEIDARNRLEGLTIESNIPGITADMDDGLSRVNIRNLTIPLSRLTVGGGYVFEELSLFDLLIYGRGDIKVDITGLNIFLSMEAKYKTVGGWKVQSIRVETSVKESFIRLDNLMNGEPMGDFLNFMIDELFKVGIDLLDGLVQQYQKEVCEVLGKLLDSFLDVTYES